MSHENVIVQVHILKPPREYHFRRTAQEDDFHPVEFSCTQTTEQPMWKTGPADINPVTPECDDGTDRVAVFVKDHVIFSGIRLSLAEPITGNVVCSEGLAVVP